MIEKAKKGSREAFEILMGDLLKVIYNYISSHVNTDEDSKDILQETMLSVWNGLKGFDNRSSLKTWVFGITRRKIVDYYRTFYKSATAQLSEFEDILTSKDEYDCINNKSDVEKAMTVLGKTEKEIVFLTFNAQLTYTEISELMGIPIGTIKSKMSGIKAKLKRQLGKEGEYERV